MGVWLDDEFPEHPKVEALDDDLARWLYVAGLCYANRNLTGGRIPKGAALRLTDKASRKLIDKLLAAPVPGHGPLWEEHADHYQIHNYSPKQQSAEKRRAEKDEAKRKKSEHARKAAEARWAAEEEARVAADSEHHSGITRASPEHPPGIGAAENGQGVGQGDFLAPPPPQASAAERATPALPNALVPLDRSSSSHHGVGERTAEEEDHHGQGPSPDDVAQLVAERRWAKLSDDRRPPEGIRRQRWVATTAANLLADAATMANIRTLLAGGLAVEAIVDLFEPPERPLSAVPSPYPEADEQLPPAWDLDANGLAVPRSVGA